MTLVYEIRGIGVLEELSRRWFSTGVLLSRNPHVDFSYFKRGSLESEYPNRLIGDSGYFLKTHGSTPDKANDVRETSQFLGLPGGAVNVEEVDKDEPIP